MQSAAIDDDLEAMKVLKLNSTDASKLKHILLLAIVYESTNVTRYLIEEGVEITLDAFYCACCFLELDLIKLVVNERNVNNRFVNNQLPTSVAKDIESVEYMLQIGGEVDRDYMYKMSFLKIKWKRLYVKYGKMNMGDYCMLEPSVDEKKTNWFKGYCVTMHLLRQGSVPKDIIRMIHKKTCGG